MYTQDVLIELNKQLKNKKLYIYNWCRKSSNDGRSIY